MLKLTNLERVLLINQLSIRQAVEKTKDYGDIIEVLARGYSLYYGDALFALSDELPEDGCRFVLNVLAMYEGIQRLADESPNDEEVQKAPGKTFLGFDGNGEIDYISFARFVMERQNRFQVLHKLRGTSDNFNSHMPNLPMYRRMLDVWRTLGEPYPMNRDQVLQVLAASAHPT